MSVFPFSIRLLPYSKSKVYLNTSSATEPDSPSHQIPPHSSVRRWQEPQQPNTTLTGPAELNPCPLCHHSTELNSVMFQ